jgi:hypothetical protein
MDPISILAGIGAVAGAFSGFEKVYSVVVEGRPIINTERYKSIVVEKDAQGNLKLGNKRVKILQMQKINGKIYYKEVR